MNLRYLKDHKQHFDFIIILILIELFRENVIKIMRLKFCNSKINHSNFNITKCNFKTKTYRKKLYKKNIYCKKNFNIQNQ